MTTKTQLASFIGKTPTCVIRLGDDELIFEFTDGSAFKLYHYQDYCESVYIESIVGDLNDLVGHPLTMCEEVSSAGVGPKEAEYSSESFTWTFYKFATIKGYVDVRWYGTNNGYFGYYGVGVDLMTRKTSDPTWERNWN